MNGQAYDRGAIFVYWRGDVFTRAHELGHAFDETLLDAAERERFARLMGMRDRLWTGTYDDGDGRVVRAPGTLGEKFADAYANCRLRRVVASSGRWETGYGYYPQPRRHRRWRLRVRERDRPVGR